MANIFNKTFDDDDFKDLNLSMKPHPNFGDILPLKGLDAIKQSIRNIIFLHKYSRPFQPYLTSFVKQYLYELNDGFTLNALQSEIQDILMKYEKRITDLAVEVTQQDQFNLKVVVFFTVINSQQASSYELTLNNIR